MTNRFYFDDSSSASSEDNLPYPKPLTRASFLTPDFDPATFLSTLHNRHQTLDDLRTELRTRSQDLNKELLDLVNENYQDFLSLGSSLKGGDEKVEEVKVGLLGFRREVEGLRGKVEGRRVVVERLVEERRGVRGEMQVGRGLLEVERRLGELEQRLMLISKGQGDGDGDVEEDLSESEESDEEGGVEVSKLKRHAEQYVYITRLVGRIGPEHPFLVKQEERILRLKQTVLLDLGSTLKQASGLGEQGKGSLLRILGVYEIMGEHKEAMAVLKELKHSR